MCSKGTRGCLYRRGFAVAFSFARITNRNRTRLKITRRARIPETRRANLPARAPYRRAVRITINQRERRCDHVSSGRACAFDQLSVGRAACKCACLIQWNVRRERMRRSAARELSTARRHDKFSRPTALERQTDRRRPIRSLSRPYRGD